MKRCISVLLPLVTVFLSLSTSSANAGDAMKDAQSIGFLRTTAGNGILHVEMATLGSPFIKIAGEDAVVTGKVLTLAVDTDNDPKTGSKLPFAHDVKGVERTLEFENCALENVSGGAPKSHCVNGFWGKNLAGASVEVKLSDPARQDESAHKVASAPIAKDNKTTKTQILDIPYAALGVHAGDTVLIHTLGWKANQFQAMRSFEVKMN
ncbi:MAG: hypothetical protein WBV39_02295 [Rudaea sp.]